MSKFTNNTDKIESVLNSPFLFKEDKTFKKSGMRKYNFNDATEQFIVKIFNMNFDKIEVETSELYILLKSANEKEIKALFEEYETDNLPNIKEVIASLDRTMHDVKQGDPQWHELRETHFTSTVPHMTKAGGEVEALYTKRAYRIAERIGGDLKDSIISSMLTRDEAEKKGYDWEEPMTRGTRLEPIVRDRVSIELCEEIIEDGLNAIDDFAHGDSGDGTMIASKDLVIGCMDTESINNKVVDVIIPKSSKVIVEIKNPSFKNFINPNYSKGSSKFIQIQTHIIAGGADYVLFVKNFEGFTPIYEVHTLDEVFAKLFLDRMLKEKAKAGNEVDYFANDALSQMF